MARRKAGKVSRRKRTTAHVESPTTEAGVPAVDKSVHRDAGARHERQVLALPCGVYVAQGGRTCIVYRVHRTSVELVRFGAGEVEVAQMAVAAFTRQYTKRWSQYPVARAARIYRDSFVPKSPDAVRVLRQLMAQ